MNRPARSPAPDSDPADAGEDLARALRRGEDVLGEWYRAVWPAVHRLCAGLLADTAEADDVAQDAMLHLVDHLERWDTGRPFGPWYRRVVINRCRDRLRAGRRRREHEERAGTAWSGGVLPDPSESAGSSELGALVDRFLRRLPPREREVFVLVDLEGRTPAEAADELGVAGSTVRAALALARRRVRDALAPHLPEGGVA